MKNFINKIGIIFFMALIFGIMSFKNVYAEGKWTEKAPAPYKFQAANAVVSNDKIYVIGGVWNTSIENKVLEYNPATDTWTEKAPMSTRRCNLAVAELNGKIYAIGGVGGQNADRLDTVEEYDISTNTWTKKASMNTCRDNMNATVVNGKIYVFGGNTNSGPAKDFQEYDPVTDKWTIKGNMIDPLQFNRVVSKGNVIYSVGGRNSEARYKSLSSYDIVTGKWSELSKMSIERNSHEAVMVSGKIYVMGGYDSKDSMLKSIEKYDPITNSWTYEGELPIANICFGAVELNGKIYIIGGSTIKGATNKVYEYDLGIVKANLKASVENSSIVLNWDKVDKATGYNVKRSLTAGGPYTTIASDVKENTYIDKDVQVDTKYYYVVTPIVDGKEGAKTNEASAIVTKNGEQPNENVGNGILNVTMTNGTIKEYDLSMTEINDFINWYNGRAEGKGTISYCIKKNANIKPFNNRKEYLVFDKIYSFEVNEYDNK